MSSRLYAGLDGSAPSHPPCQYDNCIRLCTNCIPEADHRLAARPESCFSQPPGFLYLHFQRESLLFREDGFSDLNSSGGASLISLS